MTYDNDMVEIYERFVAERHSIYLARQRNDPQPWTLDPVLANRKFTNMFRVLDPGSQFVFNLKDSNPVDVIARLIFYRLTNLPKTWYAMRSVYGRYPVASDFAAFPDILVGILHRYRDTGNQVFSGAYVIIPEPGTNNDKIEGAVRVVRSFLVQNSGDFFLAETQKDRFEALHATPGLGPFLSMQILTDWGYLVDDEPDLSFVVAGPGAKRGAKHLNPSLPAKDVIRDLTENWRDTVLRIEGRPLTPMDVQNTLCEFSKYVRETVTPRKITPYRAANPGNQTPPIFPKWW